MFNCGGTLKKGDKEEHFLIHKTQEEDDDRTRIYHGTEMDGAIYRWPPDLERIFFQLIEGCTSSQPFLAE